jgi:3-hydroxy-9,10-secoandrosta-1,3,5(10)-triene-9,17-dione monooxygenase
MSERSLTLLAGAQTDQPGLVARVRELTAVLDGNAAGSEHHDREMQNGVTAVREAGFFSPFAPRRFGAHEADPRTAVEVLAELGRADGSTAWVAATLSAASYLASLLGERGRRDVWSEDPYATVCGASSLTGTGLAKSGGVVVTGKWRHVVGLCHSQWALVGVLIVDPLGVVDRVLALVPTRQARVAGTRGGARATVTGEESTLAVDRLFVPDHHLLSLPRALTGGYAGEHPDEPLYQATPTSLLTVTRLSPVLGMAEAALEQTSQLLRSDGLIVLPKVRDNVADAASQIDTARLHTSRAIDEIENGIRTGTRLDLRTRARIRMDVSTAAHNTRTAVRLLLDVAHNGLQRDSSLQRIWQKLQLKTQHRLLSDRLSREMYGRVLAGMEDRSSYLA